MATATRVETCCPVYGFATDLVLNQLHTANVMQYHFQRQSQVTKTTPTSQLIDDAAKNVTDVWIKSRIPTVSLRRTKQKLEGLHQELRNVMKKKGASKEKAISDLKVNSTRHMTLTYQLVNVLT